MKITLFAILNLLFTVRYAYTMSGDDCNLYNNEGLPASPFRTDDGEK